MFGHQITNWSVRVALILYLIATGREITSGRGDPLARRAWVAGAACFLMHVAAAFLYHHNLSHRAAFETTAHRTQEMLGFAFGAGIYFSYAFTILWAADALWSVIHPSTYRDRANWLHYTIHGYLFFIAINGAAVFEAGVTRWGGILGVLLLAGLLIQQARRTPATLPAADEASAS